MAIGGFHYGGLEGCPYHSPLYTRFSALAVQSRGHCTKRFRRKKAPVIVPGPSLSMQLASAATPRPYSPFVRFRFHPNLPSCQPP